MELEVVAQNFLKACSIGDSFASHALSRAAITKLFFEGGREFHSDKIRDAIYRDASINLNNEVERTLQYPLASSAKQNYQR